MAHELEAVFGRRPRRRLAGRARLGAGPADVAGRRRLRLDDPRRRPLPGGGHPRGGPLGAVHDRRPGPPPARLRDRAGPPLPDPVPRRRGGHRLPARPRDRGRRAHRDDGRRRREVRRVADDLGALLGRASLGRPLLRGARGQRRLADDDHAVGLAGGAPARSAASTSRPARTWRWASGPCRPTRAWSSTTVLHDAQKKHRPEARWLRGAFWRNFQVKYREINDLHKQMLRTSAKVDAMAAGPRSDAGARPPLPGPVERLLLARPVRRHLHRPHAPGDLRAPHRRRGPRRPRRGPARARPSSATSTSTASTTSGWPGRARSSSIHLTEGAGDRRLGHPPGPSRRCARSCAGDRRRTTRRCASTRRPPRSSQPAEARRRRTGVDPRHRDDQGGRASSEQLHYDPFERRSGLVRFLAPGTDPEAWATGRAVELGDAVDGAVRGRRRSSPAGWSATRDATVAAGRAGRGPGDQGDRHRRRTAASPTLRADASRRRTAPTGRGRRAARPRVDARRCSAAAATRRPGSRSTASRDAPRRARHGAGGRRPFAQGNDYVGVSRRHHACPSRPTSGGRRSRPSRTRRPASSASTRAPGILFSWPLSLAAGAIADGDRRRHAVATTRDRAAERSATRRRPTAAGGPTAT